MRLPETELVIATANENVFLIPGIRRRISQQLLAGLSPMQSTSEVHPATGTAIKEVATKLLRGIQLGEIILITNPMESDDRPLVAREFQFESKPQMHYILNGHDRGGILVQPTMRTLGLQTWPIISPDCFQTESTMDELVMLYQLHTTYPVGEISYTTQQLREMTATNPQVYKGRHAFSDELAMQISPWAYRFSISGQIKGTTTA